jgi:hypothetical protein
MGDPRGTAAPKLGTSRVGKVAGFIVAVLAIAAIFAFALSLGMWDGTRLSLITLTDNAPLSRFEHSPN